MSIRVTLDTNTLPPDEWLGPVDRAPFEFAVVSVTAEELSGTSYSVHLAPLEQIEKHVPYGVGPYGVGPYGGTIDKDCLRRALSIITAGAFTDPDRITGLTSGELRQRRDAEIICVHVREKREIFVTRDEKGFIGEGRRAAFEAAFAARIMTPEEFVRTFPMGQPSN